MKRMPALRMRPLHERSVAGDSNLLHQAVEILCHHATTFPLRDHIYLDDAQQAQSTRSCEKSLAGVFDQPGSDDVKRGASPNDVTNRFQYNTSHILNVHWTYVWSSLASEQWLKP
jgi:hypothetical protein